MEFNVNWCRVASKNIDLGFTKIRDILRPGKTQAGTRDTVPEMRDVPGNKGRLATLVTVRGTLYKMTSSQDEIFAQACDLYPKIAHQFIATDTT